MSTEKNQSLVRRYVEEVLNRGNLEALGDFVSPDYRRYLSPTAAPLTPQLQKQRLAGLRLAFPDINLTFEDMIAEGDRVAFRMTLRGTHEGAFQGIAPTHKKVIVSALDIVRIENGKISEHWGGPDMSALLQQLGGTESR